MESLVRQPCPRCQLKIYQQWGFNWGIGSLCTHHKPNRDSYKVFTNFLGKNINIYKIQSYTYYEKNSNLDINL